MNSLRKILGTSFALTLAFGAPVAWSQSDPMRVPGSTAILNTHDTAAQMDRDVSREVKQAWSDGKNATLAMSFQENGEIAMSEGRDKEATRYFQSAEQELGTLQPERVSATSY